MTMKLGSQTGSLVNHVMSGGRQPDPVVGMGVTILSWTDRYPGTIVEISLIGATTYIAVAEDFAERTDQNGLSESQTYTFSPNPNGRLSHFRLKLGKWQACHLNPETGRWNKGDGGLVLGHRKKYHDFSF